jgi:hypothetical protein
LCFGVNVPFGSSRAEEEEKEGEVVEGWERR